MEESANRKSSKPHVYITKKGGLCRILEIVLLIVVEACLGAAAALESNRGLFHQIIVAIPLGSILFLLLCHLILGPHEAWPRLQRCSWPKIETAHDVLVLALLLPSSLVLLVPPFTTLEASAAVLTLVAVLLVALQGVDNLQKAQYRSSRPLVAAETPCNISYTRRPRRESVSNKSSSAFSPIVIPCSTPDCVSSKHRCKSPSSPIFYVHETDTDSLLHRGSKSEECCSCREPSMRLSPLGAPGTPKSDSFTCGTLSALSSRTYSVSNSVESTTFTISKSPGSTAVQTKSLTPISRTLSPDSEFLRKLSLDAQGLMLRKSSVTDGGLSHAKKNQNHSFIKVPKINLIEPTPELKFSFKDRVNESEMGSSPLLRECEVTVDMAKAGDLVSPVYCPAISVDAESPKSISTNTQIATKLSVEEPVTPDHRDALIEELGKKFSAKHPKRIFKNITSLKSLDEFSPPKTFFNDESKQLFSVTPQPAARSIKKSNREGTPIVSSQPCPNPRTSPGLPELPPLSMDYVRVYPTPQPILRSLGTSLSLSHNLPSTDEITEEKHASLFKSQSVGGDAHHYENEAVVCPTQQHEESSRNPTPYQLFKRTETGGTSTVFQYTDLTTEL